MRIVSFVHTSLDTLESDILSDVRLLTQSLTPKTEYVPTES